MGGDLPQKAGKEPTFVVWAVKDPDDANLDRVQIIKGWTKSGQIFEKIYDVAWSDNRKPDPVTGKVPAVGNTVDVKNATYTNTIGAVELKKVWRDPDFDPSLHAFYYVARFADTDPTLDHLRRQEVGSATAEFRSRHSAGARLDVSHLVCPDRGRGAQGRKAQRHSCRSEAEGGRGTRRFPANAVDRGKDTDHSQYGYRSAVQNFLR